MTAGCAWMMQQHGLSKLFGSPRDWTYPHVVESFRFYLFSFQILHAFKILIWSLEGSEFTVNKTKFTWVIWILAVASLQVTEPAFPAFLCCCSPAQLRAKPFQDQGGHVCIVLCMGGKWPCQKRLSSTLLWAHLFFGQREVCTPLPRIFGPGKKLQMILRAQPSFITHSDFYIPPL